MSTTEHVPRSGGDADTELLRTAIAESGLSARQFAMTILVRDERTIRRWLTGESPIPDVVIDKLREMLAA